MTGPDAKTLAVAGYHVAPIRIRRGGGRKRAAYLVPWGEAATTDLDRIEAWLDRFGGDVGWLIACLPSDVVVVDLDLREGLDALAWWARHGLPVSPMRVDTPSGGQHLYWRQPATPIPNSTGAIAPGVDIRGSGGQYGGLVYAPGTVVLGGGPGERYQLVDPLIPAMDLPVLPTEIVATIPPARRRRLHKPGPAAQGATHDLRWVRSQMDRLHAELSARPADPGTGFRGSLMGVAMMTGRWRLAADRPRDGAEEYLRQAVHAVWGRVDADDEEWIATGLDDGEADPYTIAEKADEEPTPLQPPRDPAPFPTDAFPRWLRAWVEATSHATQTPADLAGCCALGVLATCAGGRAVVRARPGWQEPTNLYAVAVLRPGSRKSAVVSAATRPVYTAQHDLQHRAKGLAAEASVLREVAERAAEKALRDAATAKPDQRDRLTSEAVSAAATVQAIEVPGIPRLVGDDITPEAAASLLAYNRGRLAILSAEGGIFDLMAGRYSGGVPVLDIWLKGHSGDTTSIDRKGRPSEHIERPAVTMAITVQPSVLTEPCVPRPRAAGPVPVCGAREQPRSSLGRRAASARPGHRHL